MSAPLMRHVFYAGQLYGSYPLQEWIQGSLSLEMPDGAYLLVTEGRRWYIRQWSGYTPINLCDVPIELRALCLILDIPTH